MTTTNAKAAAAITLVLAIVVVAHWPVLGAQALSLDDDEFITRNALVTHPSWASARRFFTEVLDPSSVRGYYVPLTMTSLMLDYAAGGRPTDLRAFHRTSLALHLISVALVALTLWRMVGALAPAAAAALLFGLHPLTVEPVAWIAGRKTLLAAGLAFACMLCWLEHRRGRGRAWLFASVGLYALALMSKPIVLTLPLLLLVLDVWPLGRSGRETVIEKWPFFLLSLISAVVSAVSFARGSHVVEWPQTSVPRTLLQIAWLVGFYLGKTVLPGRLSCVYPPPDAWSLSNPAVLLSVVTLLLLALVVALATPRTRAPLAGALFFIIALAPTFGVLKWSRNFAYDNYTYFPALGLLMPLAYGFGIVSTGSARGRRGAKAALAALTLGVALAEAIGTRVTLAHWKDSPTLWRHVVSVAPWEASAHNALGVALERGSHHEDAIREFRIALSLESGYADAYTNLGEALGKQGRFAEAIEPLARAARLQPGSPAALYALGVAALQLGRLNEAETLLRRAIALRPRYTEATDRLGSVLVVTGRTEEGIAMLRQSVALDPGNAHPHFALAMVLRVVGRQQEAAVQLREAIRLKPEWPDPWNVLAWLLATTPDPALRDGEEARRLAARAVELTHHRDPAALDTQAAAEAAAGRFDRAAETAREALELASRAEAVSLAREIGGRLALYERGRAYTDSAAGSAAPRAR